VEVVASLSQGRTAAAQCGLFTYKSVPVIFEPPCSSTFIGARQFQTLAMEFYDSYREGINTFYIQQYFSISLGL